MRASFSCSVSHEDTTSPEYTGALGGYTNTYNPWSGLATTNYGYQNVYGGYANRSAVYNPYTGAGYSYKSGYNPFTNYGYNYYRVRNGYWR